MGTWGTGIFDNDVACDWASTFGEADDLTLVRDALEAVLEIGDEYLDADIATEALAACEVLARLNGKWGTRDAYSEPIDAWIKAHPIPPPAELRALATQTIDRVLRAPSELTELWAETDQNTEWLATVADLRARVGE